MLITNILRGEWKFPGYIVSDCGAIDDIYLRHKVVATAPEAAAIAVKTGTDLDCGRVYPNLAQAVTQGLISEKEIDVSIARLFLARFKLGMFDSPEKVKWARIPFTVLDQPEKIVVDALIPTRNEEVIGLHLPFAGFRNKIAILYFPWR